MDDRNLQFNDVADVFSEYYLNIADNLQTYIDKTISPLGLLKNAYQTAFSNTEVIPITKRKIINIICSLNSKKSSGYDDILSKILKLCIMALINLLSYICNIPRPIITSSKQALPLVWCTGPELSAMKAACRPSWCS
jgi:hypothetical protein